MPATTSRLAETAETADSRHTQTAGWLMSNNNARPAFAYSVCLSIVNTIPRSDAALGSLRSLAYL